MKYLIKMMVLLTITAIITGTFSGCNSSKEEILAEKPDIIPAENHLEEWERELPRETEDGALYSSAIRGIVLSRDGKTKLAVSYEPGKEKESFDYWDISVPYQSLVSVDTEELYNFFELVIQSLNIESAGIDFQEADLEKSNTTLFIAYDGGQKESEKGVPEPTASKKVLIGKEDGEGHYYLAFEDEETVYLADKEILDAVFRIDPYQLILKIPVLVSVNGISQVRILFDGKTYIMSQADKQWKMNEKNVEQTEFHELYGKLLGIMLSGTLPEDREPEENRQPVLTLQFLRNIRDVSDIEVKYYEYDENSMSVSVNGQEYFLAERKQIEELMEIIKKSF